MKKTLFITILALAGSFSFAQSQSWNTKDTELNNGWQMQSSAKAAADGHQVASVNYNPENWHRAYVPGSVLGSLVNDGVYKNIFYHRNLEKVPDAPFEVPWWYRTTFDMDEVPSGEVYRLRFNGISYRADIWLNGRKIASADTLLGSFKQYIIDVTHDIKKGKNVLALKISQAKPGDLNIGFVDWNPEPPDKNMGIWRTVHLLESGPVSITYPFVRTKVDTATLQYAQITLGMMLQNHSSKAVNGALKIAIGDHIHISKKVNLAPYERTQVTLTPEEYAALSVDHPRLWWTHELGKPNLYELKINYDVDGHLSASKSMKFGIRQVSSYLDAAGWRGFKLNGKKILIKGGGWTDPMLLNPTPAYVKAGIDYAVQMNLNTIRMEGFWGEDQEIYNLCDEKGLLIMVGFSCEWEWSEYMGKGVKENKHGTILTPEKMDLAGACWRDQLLWLRNHPSIFLWLYGSDKWPQPALEEKYLAVLKTVDPTRPAISSAADVTSIITGRSGVKMRGPYDYVPPDYWYIDTANGGAYGFNTETGPGPEIPVLESLKKMIPADSLWPIGSAWLYHAARHNFHNLTRYNNAMDERMGKPSDLTDYLRKAQYLNYEGMRAMFEAFEANRFKATGIIQWMYNASWPKLWWQFYDYYLMPTGAFYGARKANEPIHISYNYGKEAVDVMNNTLEDENNLSADISVFDFNMKKVLQKNVSVNSLPDRKTLSVFSLPANLPLSKTWFLDLKLYNHQHHLISTNFYVLSTQRDLLDEAKSNWYVTPQSQYANLTMLQQLPDVKLHVEKSFKQKDGNTFATVKIKNPSDHLAFMIHLDLRNKENGKSVVPIFWDENYITLLPGEERTVTGYCHTKDLDGQQPEVTIDGWNIK